MISLASVDVRLRGVKIERNRLLNDRKVQITGIDKGTVDVTLTQEALGDALHVPVTIANGAVSIVILSRSFTVTPSITPEGRLTFSGAQGRSLTVSIPKLDYVPCFGDITVLAGRLRLSCEIDVVPAALVDAVEGAS